MEDSFLTVGHQFGFTPFLQSVIIGHSEIIDVLIQRGCNISVKGSVCNNR